jgi:hypothetical protein
MKGSREQYSAGPGIQGRLRGYGNSMARRRRLVADRM